MPTHHFDPTAPAPTLEQRSNSRVPAWRLRWSTPQVGDANEILVVASTAMKKAAPRCVA
jgi:hypothetical protein